MTTGQCESQQLTIVGEGATMQRRLFTNDQVLFLLIAMTDIVSLKSDDSLARIERQISICTSGNDDVRIVLPVVPTSNWFAQTRTAALIATAASHRPVTVMLPHKDWRDANVNRVTQSIDGLMALRFAENVSLTNLDGIPIDRADYASSIYIKKRGILEPELIRNKTLTFCAFDEESPIPILFSQQHTAKDFTDLLVHLITNSFGLKRPTQSGENERHLRDIGTFAYEIFQNTFLHASRDVTDKPIRGIRFLRIEKTIDHNHSALISSAKGFHELEQYLERILRNRKGTTSFIELAISDCGEGILKRLSSTRPDLPKLIYDDRESGLARLSEILTGNLTSDKRVGGAGLGLPLALKAAQSLEAFISLRTDNLWACRGFDEKLNPAGLTVNLTVGSEEVSAIRGTHFNILFPWHHG